MLWDINSKEVLQTLSGHDGVVLGVDVGLEDQTIVTCGLDKTIKVWKRMPVTANGHSEPFADQEANGVEAVLPVRESNV